MTNFLSNILIITNSICFGLTDILNNDLAENIIGGVMTWVIIKVIEVVMGREEVKENNNKN